MIKTSEDGERSGLSIPVPSRSVRLVVHFMKDQAIDGLTVDFDRNRVVEPDGTEWRWSCAGGNMIVSDGRGVIVQSEFTGSEHLHAARIVGLLGGASTGRPSDAAEAAPGQQCAIAWDSGMEGRK